jgi:hypothetical protein
MRQFARWAAAFALLAALGLTPSANAASPAITTIGGENMHASATFTAPRSDYAAFYFATLPDRTADGAFPEENVAQVEAATRDEILSGNWSGERRIDPGVYYVLLRATRDFAGCYLESGGYDDACAHGWSNMTTLTVPEPSISFSWSVTTIPRIQRMYLRLRATPLGEERPYRVCYRTQPGRERCAGGMLHGFDWSLPGGDSLTISTRGLPTYTIFTWHVGSLKIASKRIKIR